MTDQISDRNRRQVRMTNGAVRFVPSHPASPDRDGAASRFEITFDITLHSPDEPESVSEYLALTIRLPAADFRAPYGDIETQAARLVAPTLRSVAAEIEAQVEELDRALGDRIDRS